MDFDDIQTGSGQPTTPRTQNVLPSTPAHPLVFGFYVEYTYYPKSGKMYQNKCVPTGMQYKQAKQEKSKEQIKLKEAVNEKTAWN